MARQPRLVVPGVPHLLLQRALPGRGVFDDAADRALLADALRDGVAALGVTLHAWAAPPGELRLLLTPPDATAPARLMQHLGRRYGAVHQRRLGARGTLWDGRYGCAPVEPGAACLDAMRWVEAAADRGDPGSGSTALHLGHPPPAGRALPACTAPPAWWALGNTPFEREAAYRRLLDDTLPPARASALTRAARAGWAIGSDTFTAAVAAAAGRAVSPGRRGRPRRPAAGVAA